MPSHADRRRSPKSFRRRVALLAAVAGVGAAALWALPARVADAAEGVVYGTDGRTFTGDVTESGDEVQVVKGGISTTLPRSQVRSVEYGTFAERFDRTLEQLAADDEKGRVALGRQALDERDYDRAEAALQQALSIDPNDAEAQSLLATVRTQRRMPSGAASDRPRPAPPSDSSSDGPAGDDAPLAPPERDFLNDEQINRIKQAELRPDDRTARVRFEGSVARDYAERKGMKYGDFSRRSQAEQADLVLGDADEEAAKSVVVNNDPEPLATYRRQVQPIVLSGCASSGCHGGNQGGNFVLYNNPSEAAAYTNFYILTRYKAKVGEEGGGIFSGPAERGMIERGRADSSLLLQYGLNPKTADEPHPQVQGYNGIFRAKTDPQYRTIADWMNTSLKPVAPDYGIDYTPPGGGSDTAGNADDAAGESGDAPTDAGQGVQNGQMQGGTPQNRQKK